MNVSPQYSVLKIFKPLFKVQTLFGSVRVKVGDNGITKTTKLQKFYSIFNILFATTGHFYTSFVYSVCVPCVGNSVAETSMALIQIYAGHLMNSFIVFSNTFLHNEKNVQMFKSLYSIDELMKIVRLEHRDLKLFIVIILLLSSTVIMNVYRLIDMVMILPISEKWVPFANIGVMNEDLEAITFVSVLYILYDRVKYINQTALDPVNVAKLIKEGDGKNDEETVSRILNAFKEISRAYKIVEKTFRVFFMFLVIHMFFFQMLTVEILIVLSDNLSWGTFMSKNLIGVKFIARIMLISVCVSYLERELQKTKGLCNLAVRNCENDIVRCLLKNIYRIIDTEIEPMTVFGLFYINNVPLDLISLTATYTVVLLQFAFL